ncbi:hypothetical protein VFPBJ_11533 [Purpureocillium lilacinum]|uniref:Uncharacterized protein n=1 Tax=Purpureocillium lilacinum TaxID=33203 RepID=A0A179F6P7_PURLI|nr:hypothetical protein VFPBJ_11533 [Purpureocillium lilacinum]
MGQKTYLFRPLGFSINSRCDGPCYQDAAPQIDLKTTVNMRGPSPSAGSRRCPPLRPLSDDRLYIARDHEGKARSTLGFASQSSLAPRLTPLPQSAPQEPGGRNGPGVAGGENLPMETEANEQLAFKGKNRPPLAAGIVRRLVLKRTCDKAGPRLRAIDDELS